MSANQYFILMADIIKSRKQNQAILAGDFKKITTSINREYNKNMVSPITVTLGDEFQCILNNLNDAIDVIFFIEESICALPSSIKLRYVLSKGIISSDINTEIGWGMMGDGLTHTREKLNSLKKSKKRFFIDSFIANDSILSQAFLVYESIIDSWNIERDFPVISAYNTTKSHDYKDVAKLLNKNPDQIWKREKSMKIMEYYAMKDILKYLCMEDTNA